MEREHRELKEAISEQMHTILCSVDDLNDLDF